LQNRGYELVDSRAWNISNGLAFGSCPLCIWACELRKRIESLSLQVCHFISSILDAEIDLVRSQSSHIAWWSTAQATSSSKLSWSLLE
jgi:hypothetical protein